MKLSISCATLDLPVDKANEFIVGDAGSISVYWMCPPGAGSLAKKIQL